MYLFFWPAAVLLCVAIGLAVTLAMWLVFKMEVTIDSHTISVRKRGLFRSSTVKFATADSAFYYYRSHYDDS